MYSCTDTQAVCRGCGQHLGGNPYWKGGSAHVKRADGGYKHAAKANWYGGWVCSRSCDYRAALELEQSMPGHGRGQRQPGPDAMRRINDNWPDQ